MALMRLKQPDSIKTDLIVFTPPSNVKTLVQYGCTTVLRKTFEEDEICLALPHVPLKVTQLIDSFHNSINDHFNTNETGSDS